MIPKITNTVSCAKAAVMIGNNNPTPHEPIQLREEAKPEALSNSQWENFSN